MVGRDGTGPKVLRRVTSCVECFAWGLMHAQGVCLACYNFAAARLGHVLGQCGACRREVRLKAGYCRLCWCQAREDRAVRAQDPRSAVVIAPYLPEVRYQQLFLAGMTKRRARPRAVPRRYGQKGRPHKAVPAVVTGPDLSGAQLSLLSVAVRRDHTRARVDLRHGPAPDNPWLAWALHLAHRTAEARGWAPIVRRKMQRTLVALLARHGDGELVNASAVRAVASRYSCNVAYALEILGVMGIVVDDRPVVFDTWLETKLLGLAPGIADEARRWVRVLHDGGPRTRPRSPQTAGQYLRTVRPVLLGWSSDYAHLREVTRQDVLTCLSQCTGDARTHTGVALRSLFIWARRAGVVFSNPTNRIKLGRAEQSIWQPLSQEQITACVAAATTPQARVYLVLAAVYAARVGQIRALRLDDVDLAGRVLRIGGVPRAMDEMTHRVLADWLRHRASRWPDTANPHLLISKETALRHGQVSSAFILNLRQAPATFERLRIDRQLEEALTIGPDPLHLAEVFGICESTAIRYAHNARVLLERPHEANPATSVSTPPSTVDKQRRRPLSSR